MRLIAALIVQTLSVMVVQALFGALIAFPSTQRLFGGPNAAKSLWKWHRLSGYILVLLLSVTVWYARRWLCAGVD